MNYKLTEPARIVNNRKNTGTVINKNENDEKNDKWVVLNKKL